MMNSAEEVVIEIETWAKNQRDELRSCLIPGAKDATAVVVEARYYAMLDLIYKIEELTALPEEQES